MGKKLFGTDGIRGIANTYPMTAEVALNIGRAVAALKVCRALIADGFNEIAHEFLRSHIGHLVSGFAVQRVVTDGLQQMGLAETHAAVDNQWVELGLAGRLDCCICRSTR